MRKRIKAMAMTISAAAEDIREEFAFLDDWEERYAHIIDLGKANPPLDESEEIEVNRVRGCASQVWMITQARSGGRLALRASSDAMIVSGLIALLVRLFDGQEAGDILAFDAEGFLEEIGVKGALTAQRSNGLASMLARIRADAAQLKAA